MCTDQQAAPAPQQEQKTEEKSSQPRGQKGHGMKRAGLRGLSYHEQAKSLQVPRRRLQQPGQLDLKLGLVQADGAGIATGDVQWDPAKDLNTVWVARHGDKTRRRAAIKLYGAAALAHALVPVTNGMRCGYRFDPKLLVPDWHTTWAEYAARNDPMQALATLRRLKGGKGRMILGQLPKTTKKDPFAKMLRKHLALKKGLLPKELQGKTPYDPTLHYPMAGNLEQLVTKPRSRAAQALWKRPLNDRVAVMIIGGGRFDHLIADRSRFRSAGLGVLQHAPRRGEKQPQRYDWDGLALLRQKQRKPNPHDAFIKSLMLNRPFGQRRFKAPAFGYRVMSVRELRDLARRHAAIGLLTGAKMRRGDGPKLGDLLASKRFVHGTNGYQRVVDTGSKTELPTSLDAGRKVPGAQSTPHRVGDLLVLARAEADALIKQHPKLATLLTALAERLDTFKEQLDADPRRAVEYGKVVAIQRQMTAMCSRALTSMPKLRARFGKHPRLLSELDDIEQHYALALVFSDQTGPAERFYNTADRLMGEFPKRVLDLMRSDMTANTTKSHKAMGKILAVKGADPWYLTMFGDHPQRDFRQTVRDVVGKGQKSDWHDLEKALAKAAASRKAGDLKAEQKHLQSAAELQTKMAGRHRLLLQLHHSLTAMQAFSKSSGAVTHGFTNLDNRLGKLIQGLSGLAGAYERAKTPAQRAAIMKKLDALWASDKAYQKFYEHLYDYIQTSDIVCKIAVLVVAGLLSAGAGAAMAGAIGETAGLATLLKAGGVTVLEAMVFTGVDAAGGVLTNTKDPSKVSAGGLGKELAWNIGLFGVGKLARFAGAGAAAKLKVPEGVLALTGEVAAMTSYGALKHRVQKGKAMTTGELAAQGGIALTLAMALSLGRFAGTKLIDRIASRARTRLAASKHGADIAKLEAEREAIGSGLKKVLESAKRAGGPQDRHVKGLELLGSRAADLERRFAALLEKAATDPSIKSVLGKAFTSRMLQRSAGSFDDLVFASRAGLSSGGGKGATFHQGMHKQVAAHFKGKGFRVAEKTIGKGRKVLEITAPGKTGAAPLKLVESSTPRPGVYIAQGSAAKGQAGHQMVFNVRKEGDKLVVDFAHNSLLRNKILLHQGKSLESMGFVRATWVGPSVSAGAFKQAATSGGKFAHLQACAGRACSVVSRLPTEVKVGWTPWTTHLQWQLRKGVTLPGSRAYAGTIPGGMIVDGAGTTLVAATGLVVWMVTDTKGFVRTVMYARGINPTPQQVIRDAQRNVAPGPQKGRKP